MLNISKPNYCYTISNCTILVERFEVVYFKSYNFSDMLNTEYISNNGYWGLFIELVRKKTKQLLTCLWNIYEMSILNYTLEFEYYHFFLKLWADKKKNHTICCCIMILLVAYLICFLFISHECISNVSQLIIKKIYYMLAC